MALSLPELELAQLADHAAVERCQAGDPAAFGELYDRHRDRLLRYCTYRLGDRHAAEDVVQEAFTRAWRALPTLAGDRKFYPWLRVVAANLCTDLLRQRGRSQPAAEVDPGLVDGGQEDLIAEVDRVLVRQALERLNARHRAALAMREGEGLTYDEIALRTGVTIGTVESLLWRARQALKREFLALSGGEGLLAGLPLLAWLARRVRSVHHRFGRGMGWAARNNLAEAGAGPMAVAVLGTAVSSVIAVTGGLLPGTPGSGRSAVVGTAAYTTAGVGGLSAPARPAGSLVSPASGGSSVSGAGAPYAGPRTMHLVNPVHYGGASAQEARHDPVQASVGPVTLGLDPPTTEKFLQRTVDSVPGSPGAAVGQPVGAPYIKGKAAG